MSAQHYHPYVDHELQALARHLIARYPGIVIVEATMHTLDDGTRQQSVRYCAPIEKLLEAGLVTPEMVARGKSFDDRRKGRHCPNGDGFSLFDKTIDERGASLGAAGYWDLHVHTGAAPRERERFNTKDAKRVLKAFTLGKRRKSARGAP